MGYLILEGECSESSFTYGPEGEEQDAMGRVGCGMPWEEQDAVGCHGMPQESRMLQEHLCCVVAPHSITCLCCSDQWLCPAFAELFNWAHLPLEGKSVAGLGSWCSATFVEVTDAFNHCRKCAVLISIFRIK